MRVNLKPTDRNKSISTNSLAGKGVLMLIIVFAILACGGNRGFSEDEIRNYEDLETMVSSRKFAVEHQWANPMRGISINLLGNPNYIRFKGDSVNIHLPYFGVRHSGGAYGAREGGVRYEGLAEDFQITENPEKRNVVITFEGDGQTNENLEFRITLFTNGKASTSVNSSQRDPISYQGDIKPLPEEQE